MNGLAPHADRLRRPLPFHRPLEERQGLGLGLATAGPDRFLGHEFGPGEQSLLRLVGLIVMAVERDRHMAVLVDGRLPIDRDKPNRRPDAERVPWSLPLPW